MYTSLDVKNDIYWVGALDFDIRTFDIIMYTEYGTTYNSYVVKGSSKTVLIEAVKEKFFDEHLERLKSVVDPKKIDYLIVNHTEPDHTGSIKKLLDLNPDLTIIGSSCAIKFLKEITNSTFKNIEVKEGDQIDIGGKTLEFVSAPFLHWPDSMYTYIKECKALFTCDSFGCHYCDSKVFNDLIDGDFVDAYKYYFDCIMGPFKDFMLKAIAKVDQLEVDVICPGHGPVLRENIDKYINLYRQWCETKKANEVVIGFVSSYGYTKKLAENIAKGVEAGGMQPKLYNLETADKTKVLENIHSSKGLLLGSPTIVNDTLPPVWEILIGLNQVIDRDLTVGAFGSYGWTGDAITNIEQRYSQLKFKMPVPSLKIMLNPSDNQCKEAFEFGKKFASCIK